MNFTKIAVLTAAVVAIAGLSLVPSAFAISGSQTSQLRIEKDMPEQIVVGKPYAYTIRVTNPSGCQLDDVLVTEKFPGGYELETASPQASGTAGETAQWNLGSMKPGETRTITISGKATAVDSFVMCTKAVHSQTLCLGPKLGMPAILLEVIDTEDPVQVGGIEKFYVTVTNQGNAVDENIVIRVSFEENFDYVSSTGPTQGRAQGSRSVEFAPLASLAPGHKATWEVTAKAQSTGDHRTSVKLTSDALKRSVDETESTHVY
ncbi:MAG: Large cysteine-rich periplasmic protein omcB precursor [Candidatus Omnitrophica bacterium ADurb.Bin277]|nr:MAG: Large cysteine-rich periplasmic protein omcB precursor [Candidatus Omnitrophica bacterium ADurb.Bin277]